MLFQHKWRCFEKQLIGEVWKYFRETSKIEFLSVELQAYSFQAATLPKGDSFCNIYRKLAVLKGNSREKTLWWTIILRKLQPCSIKLLILSKKGAHVRPSCRSGESSIFTGKPPWWSLFSAKVAGIEFIPAISSKRTPLRAISYMSSTW